MNGRCKFWGLQVFFLSLFFFTGCSSLVGKGDELYKSGLYYEAADFYERALIKDPNDVEASIGLNRARHKIIDRGLIEVRMLRLSLNMAGASQKLEQILRNQSNWHLQVQGAVTHTQAEETRFAKNWLIEEINQVSQSAHPDQFRWFRHRYSYLIANAQLESLLAKYRHSVNQKGLKNCESLAGYVSGQRFFLKEFAGKYCAFWGRALNEKTDNIDMSRFDSLSIDNNIRNNAKGVNVRASISSLKERFLENIWYSPIGKQALKVNTGGRIVFSKTVKKAKNKVHYTVEKVIKSDDGSTNIVKEVKKSHVFFIKENNERLTIDLSIKSHLLGEIIQREVNYKTSHYDTSHDEYFPPANLEPKEASGMNVRRHTDPQLSMLNSKFLDNLTRAWEHNYCDREINDPSGENVLRCAKIKPDHGFVDNWFKQNFGLNYQQMVELYGL